jgi:hypothetical protein
MFGAERFLWHPRVLRYVGFQQDMICRISIADIVFCAFSRTVVDWSIGERGRRFGNHRRGQRLLRVEGLEEICFAHSFSLLNVL